MRSKATWGDVVMGEVGVVRVLAPPLVREEDDGDDDEVEKAFL
jgi:hypothetical protein